MGIAAQLNVTPDGFCNHPDVDIDDAFMEFAVRCLDEADRLLLGRRTYDLFVGHWPEAARDPSLPAWEQRLGQAIDGIDRLVVSRDMTGSDWGDTAILHDFTEESARRLGAEATTLVLGSPSIIAQLAAWGALDRLMLSVHPVMGGQGVRPFEGFAPQGMAFERVVETGANIMTYVFVASPPA